MYIVPIFGMIFFGWLFYLRYREKVALIAKGMDPSHLDPKPNSQPGSLKYGLLLIGTALGILSGYIVNLTFGIPNLVAYSTMIFIICGILLIFFHKSKTK